MSRTKTTALLLNLRFDYVVDPTLKSPWIPGRLTSPLVPLLQKRDHHCQSSGTDPNAQVMLQCFVKNDSKGDFWPPRQLQTQRYKSLSPTPRTEKGGGGVEEYFFHWSTRSQVEPRSRPLLLCTVLTVNCFPLLGCRMVVQNLFQSHPDVILLFLTKVFPCPGKNMSSIVALRLTCQCSVQISYRHKTSYRHYASSSENPTMPFQFYFVISVLEEQ